MIVYTNFRVTEDEKIKNTQLMNNFILAFTSLNTSIIAKMLHPNGFFFQKFNKNKALGFIHELIHGENDLSSKNFAHWNKGFGLEQNAGQEVIELRFSSYDPLKGESPYYKPFGEVAEKAITEIVFRFVLTFKDGQIFTIQNAKCFCENIQNLLELN